MLEHGRTLLHSLAVIYWITAVAIASAMILLGPVIASRWLRAGATSYGELSGAVMLMGAVIACRWPIGLYQGALSGMHRLTLVSGIAVVMTTLASVGAVLVLMFLSRSIQGFFVWQAVIGLIYALVLRSFAWRVLGRGSNVKFAGAALSRIWKYSLGTGGIALSAVIFTQLDKVLLSKVIGLSDFGRYVLAGTVVNGLYVLVTPLFNALYPRFSQLVALEHWNELATLYRIGTRMLAAVLFPVAVLLAVLAHDVLFLWTGNEALAVSVAPLVALLAAGSALHGVMYFPYALQLAHGLPRVALRINMILLIAQVPLVVTLGYSLGAIGGALSWLILHVLYLLLGTWMTHRRMLPQVGRVWLMRDVGVPLAAAALLGVTLRFILVPMGLAALPELFVGCSLAVMVIIISFTVSPDMYALLTRNLRAPA